MFFSFKAILYFSYLNMMFFIQHFISFIFITKMDRKFDFPTFIQFADLCLFVSSLILVLWIQLSVLPGLPDVDKETKGEYELALM